jgi:hypothetical protein
MPCSVDSSSGQGAVLSGYGRRGKPGNIRKNGIAGAIAEQTVSPGQNFNSEASPLLFIIGYLRFLAQH